MHRSKIAQLLDHLVGAQKQRRRHLHPDGLGHLEINDQFKLSWVLNRQLSGISAFNNAVNLIGSVTV